MNIGILFFNVLRFVYLFPSSVYYSFWDGIQLLYYVSKQSQQREIAAIISTYHVLEKGLVMPNMRFGFGEKVILRLIFLCNRYIRYYGNNSTQLNIAAGVLSEYLNLHRNQNYHLNQNLERHILVFLKQFSEIDIVSQLEFRKQDFYKNINSSFDAFATSRHSIRCYSEIDVSIDLLKKAVSLANSAPSACNRQSVRVKIVADRTKIQEVLCVQNGNRGFGDKCNKLIVITTELSAWNAKARQGGALDAGIYAMNLLYALHHYKISACPLNCYFAPANELKIHHILKQIPKSEKIMMLITCGIAPEHFKCTLSHRYNVDENCIII